MNWGVKSSDPFRRWGGRGGLLWLHDAEWVGENESPEVSEEVVGVIWAKDEQTPNTAWHGD